MSHNGMIGGITINDWNHGQIILVPNWLSSNHLEGNPTANACAILRQKLLSNFMKVLELYIH